mgnify:CR=1 FL=1
MLNRTKFQTNKLLSVCVCMTMLLGFGCKKSSSESNAEQSSAKPDTTVLAKVGDDVVTAEEFDAFLRFKKISVRSPEQLQKQLEEYARRKALAQAAKKSDVLDQALVEAELREFEKEMLISRYFDQKLKTSVTREGVENYYKSHEDEYASKRVRVSHILARLTPQTSDEERAKKKAKIEEAKRRLDKGDAFEEVAKSLSDDRVSANRGGDMGWVREGAIAPKFSEVAFSLNKGEISQPIETGFGIHIIKVTEAPKVQRRPLTAVEGDIRYKLRAESKQKETDALISSVPVEITLGSWQPKQFIASNKAPAGSAKSSEKSTGAEENKQ